MRLVLAALASFAALASAQSPDWKALSDESIALYRNDDLAGAQAAGTQAVEVATRTLGPDNLVVATTLANLAAIHFAQKDYAGAEPLYLRALAIREKALGPDSPAVGALASNLATLYDEQDDLPKAEQFYKRALAIREKGLPGTADEVKAMKRALWAIYLARGELELAEKYRQPGDAVPPDIHALRVSKMSNTGKLVVPGRQ